MYTYKYVFTYTYISILNLSISQSNLISKLLVYHIKSIIITRIISSDPLYLLLKLNPFSRVIP